MSKKTYDTIDVLEGLEHIRKRPGMYIGSTENPTHLALEVLDNAVDEAAEGATRIDVTIGEDSFCISDNGRGFPLKDSKGGDAVVSAFTKLFSGGKFNTEAYNSSRGLNGIGLTAVNALSTRVQILTRRKSDSKTRVNIFERSCHSKSFENEELSHGTTVIAYPDPDVFDSVKVDGARIKEHCRLAATLNPKLTITFNGKKVDPYKPEDMLGKDLSSPVWSIVVEDDNHQRMQIYFAYASGVNPEYRGAVNRARCDLGSHINSAWYSLKQSWRDLISGRTIDPEDVDVGLRMFVAADVQSPAYTSQTKEKLEIRVSQLGKLRSLMEDEFSKVLRKHPDDVRKLLKKFEEYRKQVNRINAGEYLEQVVEYGTTDDGRARRSSTSLENKLIECQSTQVEGTELIIVEGDSAAGPAIRTRDRTRHAILPLRGKILNVVDHSIQKIMDNLEVRSLVNGIGAGAFHKQSVDRIRYERIVICTDADADGQQIMALLIGCLCYVMPEVVLDGRVYVALCPLYTQWEGKKFIPRYSEDEIDRRKPFERCKGLGSMDDIELHTVLFNEDQRRLVQLRVDEDDIARILHVVSTSVGKKEVLRTVGLVE